MNDKSTKRRYSYGRQSISSSDIDAVVKAMRSDFLTQGPFVARFEQSLCEYTGARYAVAVANGTDLILGFHWHVTPFDHFNSKTTENTGLPFARL